MKKIAIVLNGISLKKDFFYSQILPALSSVVQVEVVESRMREDAIALTSKLVYKGFDAIVAAGGDGTLHEVVNGLLQGNEQSVNLPAIGLIPLGSGNDFARTMNLKKDKASIINIFSRFSARAIDVGKINFPDSPTENPRYFINIADIGMGPEVVERLSQSGRSFGTLAAYYAAIFRTFLTFKRIPVSVKTQQWEWQGTIRSLAVANGKYFGSGIGIAPDAMPDDGVFSCFIAGNVSVLDFILQQGRLRSGKRARHDAIEYREATTLSLHSSSDAKIEADGELVGNLPVRIDVVPKRLKFLC
jgi:diacylglycerol kinase (ATP)